MNHADLLHKLRSVGVGSSILNIFEHILANRTQRVVIDGVASSSVPDISGVPQAELGSATLKCSGRYRYML